MKINNTIFTAVLLTPGLIQRAVAETSRSSEKCGGAVNYSASDNSKTQCKKFLWDPTGESSMHCFAYGGNGDPCNLDIKHDTDQGINKSPTDCTSDTFYLWDEPDTNGDGYKWAAETWLMYSKKYEKQLTTMRAQGTKVTSPLFRTDDIQNNVATFFKYCGTDCTTPGNPSYIDILAINAFCGPWNTPDGTSKTEVDCALGSNYIYGQMKDLSKVYNKIPVYITNWSRITDSSCKPVTTDEQVGAINAVDNFFQNDSPIERVYWYGAINYQKECGGKVDVGNFLTDKTSTGKTLGSLWKDKCAKLNSLKKEKKTGKKNKKQKRQTEVGNFKIKNEK